MEYLDREGRDPLGDDIDPSEALPEADEDLTDLEDFEAPEDLEPVEGIEEDEPT